jgi:hypothetical protein
MTVEQAFVLGILTPFLMLFTAGFVVWAQRRISQLVLHSKPANLPRRIRLAAQLVDGRRTYRTGAGRLFAVVVVGRQYRLDDQARAVLLDEFMPV